MASYRLLAPHYINNALLPAGSVVSTGVELPDAWVPAPNCEPLDADSLAQFYVQGPVLPSMTMTVARPATAWGQIGNGFFALTGLGSALAPVWAWRI